MSISNLCCQMVVEKPSCSSPFSGKSNSSTIILDGCAPDPVSTFITFYWCESRLYLHVIDLISKTLTILKHIWTNAEHRQSCSDCSVFSSSERQRGIIVGNGQHGNAALYTGGMVLAKCVLVFTWIEYICEFLCCPSVHMGYAFYKICLAINFLQLSS